MIPFCRSHMLLACGWYATHGVASVPLAAFSLVISNPQNAPSLSERNLTMFPYRASISSRNCATVSESLVGTALNSTNLRKLQMATIMYRLPFLSHFFEDDKVIRSFQKWSGYDE